MTQNKKHVVGVTGGVGSGKSTVLSVLKETYGARIILADEVAHRLMEPGQEGYRQVAAALGPSVLKPDGTIDRRAMAQVIFTDGEARKTVNAIIHPMVWEEIRREIREAPESLIVVEAALVEENAHDIYDEMWYVYTSREKRIRRLMDSRGYSREKCKDIMKSQFSEEEFRAVCTREINNGGTPDETRIQIRRILKDEGWTV